MEGRWSHKKGRLTISCLFFIVMAVVINLSACHSGEKKKEGKKDTVETLPFPKMPDSLHTTNDSAKWFLEVGKQLIQTEDYKNAEKSLKKAIHLKPLASEYYSAMGQLYLEETFRDSAYKYFSIALHLNAENKSARLQIAFILWLKDKYKEALLQTDTLLHQDAKQPGALGIRSQIYEALGDTDKAFKEMEKAAKMAPKNYSVVMRMGDLLLKKNSEKALSFYLKASKLDSTAAEPYYCMGMIYEEREQEKKAVKSFNQSIILDAHFIPAYMHLGKLYEKEKNWEKAGEIYTLAIRMAPTNSEAYFKKGQMEEKKSHIEAAISEYKQALVFDDKNKKAEKALERLNRKKEEE